MPEFYLSAEGKKGHLEIAKVLLSELHFFLAALYFVPAEITC